MSAAIFMLTAWCKRGMMEGLSEGETEELRDYETKRRGDFSERSDLSDGETKRLRTLHFTILICVSVFAHVNLHSRWVGSKMGEEFSDIFTNHIGGEVDFCKEIVVYFLGNPKFFARFRE